MEHLDPILAPAGGAGAAASDAAADVPDSEDEVVEVATLASTSISGVKRGRPAPVRSGRAKTDARVAFDKLTKKHPSLGSTHAYFEAYKMGTVTCLCCNSPHAVNNSSNLTKHFDTATHKAAFAASRGSSNVLTLQRASALVPTVLEQEQEKVKELQAWLALASIRFAVPADVPRLLDGALFAAAATLKRVSKPLTVGGSMDRALDAGHLKLCTEMAFRLRGQSMCIIIDEATTRLAGYKRPMAVILGCSAVGKPMLAKLLFDMPTAPEAAAGIRSALSLYRVDIATQVTCLVGDNAALVDAIAEQLSLPRLRCIPHCLHLVFKKGTAGFKRWAAVTQGLSRVLTQGGTPYRLMAMREARLDANRLRGNPLRWGQMQDISKYLLEEKGDLTRAGVLEVVRSVVATHTAFRLATTDDSESGDEDSDTAAHGGGGGAAAAATAAAAAAAAAPAAAATRSLPAKVALKKLREALEVGVDDGRRMFVAALECYLVEVVFGSIPALLTAAGADPEHLDSSLPTKLQMFRDVLSEAADVAMHGVVMERVFEKGMVDYKPTEKLRLIATYSPIIRDAARAALDQYDKYIPRALEQLRHRMRFHPATKPEAIQVGPGRYINAADLEAFFGVAKGAVTLEVASEWRKYVRDWPGMSEKVKARSAAAFWAAPDIKDEYPHLAKLGRWYADMPTSSVAAERAFGVMRAMESTLRYGMEADAVERELMAKVNSWMVDDMLERTIAACAGKP